MNPNRIYLSALTGLLLALTAKAQAELISVNFTDADDSSTIIDDAVLGEGTWNQIQDASPNVSTPPLAKSNGTISAVTMAITSPTTIEVETVAGNSVQSESWRADDANLTCTISGLLRGQVFQVAVYVNRDDAPDVADEYSINGVSQTASAPGAMVVPLPGEEGTDYLLFTTTASVTGQISIVGPGMAAIQVQGILDAGEDGPKLDGRITKLAFSNGGRGNNRYIIGFSRSQSITQQAKRRQTKRYFANFENEGTEIDRCFLMVFANKRQAKLKIKDRDAGGNITASALRKNYRYLHEKGQTRRFEISVKPLKKRGTIKTRISAVSSTKVRSNQDSVSAVTKIRK